MRSQTRTKYRKRLDNNTYSSASPSTPSYSYDKLNENTDLKTTVLLPPYFNTSIQIQHNSASNASVDENDAASAGFYQITNRHGNAYGKKNNHSQSYETTRKNNCCYYSFGDTISTTNPTPTPTLYPPERKYMFRNGREKCPRSKM